MAVGGNTGRIGHAVLRPVRIEAGIGNSGRDAGGGVSRRGSRIVGRATGGIGRRGSPGALPKADAGREAAEGAVGIREIVQRKVVMQTGYLQHWKANNARVIRTGGSAVGISHP